MKIVRGDKSIGIMIHTYMETSQGNFPSSYLYLKLKCHVFCFLVSLFFSYKVREQESGTSPPRGEGWHQWN
jgi:hypothetical protein